MTAAMLEFTHPGGVSLFVSMKQTDIFKELMAVYCLYRFRVRVLYSHVICLVLSCLVIIKEA